MTTTYLLVLLHPFKLYTLVISFLNRPFKERKDLILEINNELFVMILIAFW